MGGMGRKKVIMEDTISKFDSLLEIFMKICP